MRNLKRALSLAVASVMLLGLMVVGTGAVSVDDFGDADQIASENQEAVAISVGLGSSLARTATSCPTSL